MYTNGQKIFQIRNNNETSDVMDCLNGIRVLSIVWVIYGHTLMLTALGPLINSIDLLKVKEFLLFIEK